MPQNNATINTIQVWLDFALQQIAAESYLNNGTVGNQVSFRPWLIRGNTPLPLGADPNNPPPPDQFVALTPDQADQFLQRYQIVDHHANDSSGCSATLLFDTVTQQYTLAIRSTEYKNPSQGGDYDRDGFPGAGGEINKYGFAFGQLAALEDYYAKLRAPDGALASAGPINMQGYSLSGHLALVFTELHAQEVNKTYVFNSAGRGKLSVVSGASFAKGSEVANIQEMLKYYRQVLLNPASASPNNRAPGLYQVARDLQLAQSANFKPFESVPDPVNFGTQRPNLHADPRHSTNKGVRS